jgi:hypothetical protein
MLAASGPCGQTVPPPVAHLDRPENTPCALGFFPVMAENSAS